MKWRSGEEKETWCHQVNYQENFSVSSFCRSLLWYQKQCQTGEKMSLAWYLDLLWDLPELCKMVLRRTSSGQSMMSTLNGEYFSQGSPPLAAEAGQCCCCHLLASPFRAWMLYIEHCKALPSSHALSGVATHLGNVQQPPNRIFTLSRLNTPQYHLPKKEGKKNTYFHFIISFTQRVEWLWFTTIQTHLKVFTVEVQRKWQAALGKFW